MSDNNEIIKKLLSIATNQQKIITKMAQQMGLASNVGTTSVSLLNTLENLLSNMPEASGLSVESVTLSPQDGSVKGKLVMPESFVGTDKFRLATNKLKAALSGKNVTGDDGNSYTVTTEPTKIQFVGMSV